LVEKFNLLRPLMEHMPLVKRLSKAGKRRSAEVIAWALIDSCILDIHTILRDGDETNPSILTLVRPFLRRNRERNAKFLDCLETQYSDWPIYWPEQGDKPWPPNLIQAWKEDHYRQNQARHPEFQRIVNLLARDWGSLQTESQRFFVVRNNWIAHYELERDSQTGRFRHPEMPNLVELYPVLKRVVRIITRSVARFALLLKGTDISPEEFQRGVKKTATIFWNLRRPSDGDFDRCRRQKK
jgi:hypothetical protein